MKSRRNREGDPVKSRRSLGVYFVSCLFPSPPSFRPACGESQDSKTLFRENPERGIAPQHLLALGGEILSVVFVYLHQFPVNMYTIFNIFFATDFRCKCVCGSVRLYRRAERAKIIGDRFFSTEGGFLGVLLTLDLI